MRVVFISSLAAVLFAYSGPTEDSDENKYQTYSWALGQTYESTFTEEQLLSTPIWRPEDESPPVPARKAIRLAAKVRDAILNDSDTVKWQLRGVQLQPMGNERWFWLVQFEPFVKDKAQNGDALAVIVLMDGTVIKPRAD